MHRPNETGRSGAQRPEMQVGRETGCNWLEPVRSPCSETDPSLFSMARFIAQLLWKRTEQMSRRGSRLLHHGLPPTADAFCICRPPEAGIPEQRTGSSTT